MIDVGSVVKIHNPMSGFNGLEGSVEEIHEDSFKTKPNGDPIVLATVAINFPTAKGYAIVREIFPVDFLELDTTVSDLSESYQDEDLYEFTISVKEDNPFVHSPKFFELTDYAQDDLGIAMLWDEKLDRQGNYVLKHFSMECTLRQLQELLKKFPELRHYLNNRRLVNKAHKKSVQELEQEEQAKIPVDLSEDKAKDKEEPVCCICGKKVKEIYDFNDPYGAIDKQGKLINWTSDARCCIKCNMNHVVLGRVISSKLNSGGKISGKAFDDCALDINKLDKRFLVDDSNTDLSENYRDDDILIYNLEGLMDYKRILNQVIKDVEDYINDTWDYSFLEIDQDDYDDPAELEKVVHEEALNYAKDFISEVQVLGYKGELIDWKKSNVPGEYMDTIQNARYFVQYKNGDIYIGDEDTVTVSNIVEAATAHKLSDRIAEKFEGIDYLREGQEYIDKLTYGEKVDLSEDLDGLNKYLTIKDDDKVSDEDFVKAIDVVGPNYFGGKYPPFNKYAINESCIPHVMRYKEWDCWEDYDASDDALHIVLDWTTQEDFTKEQLDDFKAEVCRCIRELLKYHNIEDIISLDLRVRSRDNRQKTFRDKLLIDGNKIDIDLSEGK